MKKIFCVFIAVLIGGWVSAGSLTVQVNVPVGEGLGTNRLVNVGSFNTVKNGLSAEVGKLWGVSNTGNTQGMLYFTYSDLAESTLPATIQAGTYILSARVGNDGTVGFSGLNDISAGVNTLRGSVAGFFVNRVTNDATGTKNNMYTEFNAIPGVTYTQPTAANPGNDVFTTWTFTWEVSGQSAVIGSDPYLGLYTKTGTGGGNGFWDDSILSYDPPKGTVIAIQ